MARERLLTFSVGSVVEDVLQQHGARLCERDLASRKAEEAAARRYEVAGWLRSTLGAMGTKDMPAEPSEEEFIFALRNGIILCHVLNKIQPGLIPKIVEVPDSALPPDGAAISAFQYFENVRNFLDALLEMRIPTFEASDLKQGGNCQRIVSCILGLKSYSQWKQAGGTGSWRYGSAGSHANTGKFFTRKNSEPFMGYLHRTHFGDKSSNISVDHLPEEHSNSTNGSRPLATLLQAILGNKKPEEVPELVESLLNKVMEEFESRLANQNELLKIKIKDPVSSDSKKILPKTKVYVEEKETTRIKRVSSESGVDKESISQLSKQQVIVDQQKRDIQELRQTLQITKAGMNFLQTKYSEDFNKLGRHLNGLAHAATNYRKVLEENRKLYNQVQDLKGNIRVYCRVRPLLPGQHRLSTVDYIDGGNITIVIPSKFGKEGRRTFSFNKIFGPSSSQAEVFADTQPLIRSVLDGYNVCIFAYGQTGSGKTHTMTGPRELTDETQGVNFRALSDLFFLSEQRRDSFSYDISVQMIEIYNEQVRDLLVVDGGLNKRLEIRNTAQNGLNVPDANLIPVYSTSDVLELMSIGQQNRVVGATALNDRSSRSHSCLTVHVQGRDLIGGATLRGCMHLVDLAGSERVDKSEASGERLKEAQYINKSLSALGDVIAALAQKNGHVPYRNSKLTQLLQDSLGGKAKTLMFVHTSPEMEAIGESISTLKFAERVATVELGAAKVNKESGEVKELREQIANLKAALSRNEGGDGSDHSQGSMATPEISKLRTRGISPLHSSRLGKDISGGNSKPRQPMEEVGNIEHSQFRQRGPSFDLQELSNSPLWPDIPRIGPQDEGDEVEINCAEWVDKMMVNKGDAQLLPDSHLRKWHANGGNFPKFSYMSYQGMNGLPYQQFTGTDDLEDRIATTDDSDELDVATSDSSEPLDILWQFNVPKLSNTSTVMASNLKMPRPKMTHDTGVLRSPNLVHQSNPHKLSKGSGQSFKKVSGNHQTSGGIDAKRCSANGKLGNRK